MSAVLSGRRMAETQMTLTLEAFAPSDTPTVVNGQETFPGTSQGTTPGKIHGQSKLSAQPYTRTVTIGGAEVPVVEAGLHIPIAAPIPTAGEYGKGWEYVVTAVSETDDPALLGRRYLVANSPAMSHATARRLDVAEVPR